MKRKTLTLLLVGAAALAVLAGGSLLTPTVDASGGCGPCGGATRSVTGNGSGNNCSEALDAAEDDAVIKSFAGFPTCSPCQTSTGIQHCAMPSCYPGPCPPNSYNASSTLYYKCQACDIGPLDPLP
jgi:hypothetical protein